MLIFLRKSLPKSRISCVVSELLLSMRTDDCSYTHKASQIINIINLLFNKSRSSPPPFSVHLKKKASGVPEDCFRLKVNIILSDATKIMFNSQVDPQWLFHVVSPNFLIKQLLKEWHWRLKGFIKSLLCWWSCPAGSLTRGQSPALMQIDAMRPLGPGRAPSQITQSEFSRKLNSSLVTNQVIFILFAALKWKWPGNVIRCCVFVAQE